MEEWLRGNVWERLSGENPSYDDRELPLAHTWTEFLDLSPFLRRKLHLLLHHIQELRKTTIIYPPSDKIMWWSYCCDPEDIKVVILGQDPYYSGQATGLAFSVDRQCQIPPSLRCIYKELASSVPSFTTPSHGCLDGWARQGVLLLNTILTVEKGKAGSHERLGWDWFTNYIISSVSSRLCHCVFLLWGKRAIDRAPLVDGQKHLVLKAQHPSPLAALSGRTSKIPRFLGCNHFNIANEYLTRHGRASIDWNVHA
ncbi:ORF46 [Retroperitoneal fibromatosis-associated herpesvirus]|uniref:ORF46 n=1 Tax=Retroperitoneal fibromatosis-associated herpesvirus TaxID=111469 RepID=U5NM17_9GAMA|nr:ORF46 [Retroperitoneal fibromatosis-associated herpesvirus]AGY30727.1 ORF46 [Retroperitoneal fibromatosis-associated herpesvirus]